MLNFNFKVADSESGFGLIGIIVGLVIISIMAASALPYLSGYYRLSQAKAAVNAANSLIDSEIQYQQASYSNNAEQNKIPSGGGGGGDYFGTVSQMIQGMNILPENNRQQFLPQGMSLSVVNYQGNGSCINEAIGENTVTECLKDEGNGQFELLTAGLNGSGMNAYIPMFENGIKGGVSGYSGGVLTTQVSVPFGFSAYPKIQNGSGSGNNTVNNNNTAAVEEAAAAAAQQAANQALVSAAWANVNSSTRQNYNAALQYAYSVDATVCGSFNNIC